MRTALDYEEEAPSMNEQTYVLQDGFEVVTTREGLNCGEILFCPSLWDLEFAPLPELVRDVIEKCDDEIASLVSQTIILSGGNTKNAGFVERFEKEVRKFLPYCRIIADSNRDQAYVVGAELATQIATTHLFISKEEANEQRFSNINRFVMPSCRPENPPQKSARSTAS